MKEENQINNSSLKINICNNIVKILLERNLIGEESLSNLKVDFGYIFKKTDGMLEGLVKVICKEKIFYVAIQKNGMMLVNINETQYNETIEYMKGYHECLQSNLQEETELQKNRKEKNNKYLIENNIATNDNLICQIKDEEVNLKSIDEICKRAITCLITIQIACDIRNDNYKESLDYFTPLYKKYNVENELNSKEKRIIDGTYTEQDIIDMDWAYESYWALCWSLGLVDDIKDGGTMCDCEKAILFVKNSNSLDEFKSHCQLRNKEEILDMYDLYYRYNWAINEKYIDNSKSIGNLEPSNVIERRRALEWLISDEKDWYELELNA